MNIRKHRQGFLATLAFVMLLSIPAPFANAAPSTAGVVSTPELGIRECPRPDCETLTTIPLGEKVTVTADENDGYLPVKHGDDTGWARALYLATDPEHVPFLDKGETGCKRIALIFNIGVGWEPDTGILDTLLQENVPATMFAMGWWADQHPSILNQMAKDGYEIGSHGYDGIELTGRPDAEVTHDIRDATTAIGHATDSTPAPYFTAFAAAMDERVRALVAGEGYLPVEATVLTADWKADATEAMVYDRIMDGAEDGAIVELHLDAPASATSTGRALPRVITDLRADGYRFVSIPEMAEPCVQAG
ncbi:MAG: polysaccharide deacetylase family protein [Thermomicrobiales bacterium]